MKRVFIIILVVILIIFVYFMHNIDESSEVDSVINETIKLKDIIDHNDKNYYVGDYSEIISKPNMKEYTYLESGLFKIIVVTDQDVINDSNGGYDFSNVNNATCYNGLAGSFYLYVNNTRIKTLSTYNGVNIYPELKNNYKVGDREIIEVVYTSDEIIDSTGKLIFDDLKDLYGSTLEETVDGIVIKNSYINFDENEFGCIVCSKNTYCKNVETKDDYSLDDIVYDEYLLSLENEMYKASFIKSINLEEYKLEQKYKCELEYLN